ncbi:MAG: helix-turn-helix transcriptional regulator [Aerococcaceae bacterium]|nr:helix-turn-helix transcriptional regulator [Aerococcaceae bacterium]
MGHYADNIKRIRRQKEIRQAELAEGICSQGMISKIEKKQLRPDIDLLILIAKRLGVSVSELIGEAPENYQEKLTDYINNMLEFRQYDMLETYLNTTDSQNVYVLESFHREWLEGVILAENYGKIEEAINKMTNLVTKLEKQTEADMDLKVNLYNGIAGNYTRINNYKKAAEYVDKGIELVKRIPVKFHVRQKLHYTASLVKFYLADYVDSVFNAQLALQLAVEKSSLYLVDDLLFLIADAYEADKKYDEAKKYLAKASLVADLKNNVQLKVYIERLQSKLDKA